MTNTLVDPYKLAANQQTLEGKIAIAVMTRAAKLLAADLGEIEYNLAFAMDAEDVCVINGRLHANLTLCCQRCLQQYTQVIDGDFVVSPVADDSETKDLASNYEPVIAKDGMLDIFELVEDELILELPIVPLHVDDQICKPAQMQEQDTAQNLNPFQVLQTLKANKGHTAEDK